MKSGVAVAGLACLLNMSVQAQSVRIGPSFDCASAAVSSQPLARIICSDQDLSRLDLAYVAAYQALRHSLPAPQRTALAKEAQVYTERNQKECSVAATMGATSAISSQTVSCLRAAYARMAQELRGRLRDGALEEAGLPPEQFPLIQQALKDKGYLPIDAQVDGVFGPATRSAIGAWQRANKQTETGFAGPQLLSQVRTLAPAQPPKAASLPPSRLPSASTGNAASGLTTQLLQGVFVIVALREPDTEVLLQFPSGKACSIDTSKDGGSVVRALVKLNDRLSMSLSQQDYSQLVNEVVRAARKACPSVRICSTYAVFNPTRRGDGYDQSCEDTKTGPLAIQFSNSRSRVYRSNGFGGLDPDFSLVRVQVEHRSGVDVITSFDDYNLRSERERVASEERRNVQQQSIRADLKTVETHTAAQFAKRESVITNIADFIDHDQVRALAELAKGRKVLITPADVRLDSGKLLVSEVVETSKSKIAKKYQGNSFPGWGAVISGTVRTDRPWVNVNCLVDVSKAGNLKKGQTQVFDVKAMNFEHDRLLMECSPAP